MEGGKEADRSNKYPESPPRSGDPPTPPCKYRRKQSTSAHVGLYPCPKQRCPHPERRTKPKAWRTGLREAYASA